MKELKYPSKETIYKLTKDLKLRRINEYTQDWEIEVANVTQLAEYIKYYEDTNLNVNEKTTLMRIILEAYNDYILLEETKDDYEAKIEYLIKKDYSIFNEIIEYWSCDDANLEDCFAITSFIRSLQLQFQPIYSAISSAINQWDPIGLFPMAPEDEYRNEIIKIFTYLDQNPNVTEEELAQKINEIFQISFGTDVYFEDIRGCMNVAKQIIDK